MSDHDDLDFDAEKLRSVDRPIPPAPDGDARIRADMLAAFDQVVEHGVAGRDDASDIDDMGTLRLFEDEAPRALRTRRWSRGGFYAAAAALVLLVAVAGLLTRGDGGGRTDVAERNSLVVEEFCSAIGPDVENVVAFLADATGERPNRALVSLELLSQEYLDTAGALTGDEFVELRSEGERLVASAGDARSATVRSGTPDTAQLQALSEALADAIDDLPGSADCRADRLRGSR
ncbi:MAG: hypothetical protein AAF480_12355 [Actinomycetota bacterium]